ncbi:MAG: PQQ-like beta-propeller repeat protein, partial [Treponema sp.]|nr:PQQ-like beta-propeller repeat protein [Treponema sp.]
MKFKENFRIFAIIGGIFALLYIFLAVRPLGTELYFTPMWTTDIAHTQVSSSTAAGIPFKLGKNIGYFTEDGNIISNTSFDYKASISSDYYAIFNENATNIPFFNKSGEQVGILKDSGFPYFEDNRIYMFLPGGNSFAQYDSEGKRKWIYEGTSPVLAFSSSEAGTIAGFADGTLVTFDNNGNIDQNFIPGGSDYPVILGADISDSGEYLACISGQNRQRFILAKKDKGHSKIIYHEYLAKNQTKQVLVHFDKSGDTVYFNYNSGLGIVGTKSLKHA